MSRVAMNEMQAVLQQITEELASLSERRESLTEEADHMGVAIQSMLRRSRQLEPETTGVSTSRQLTLEEIAPSIWREDFFRSGE